MAQRDARRWLPTGALIGALLLGGTIPTGASPAEPWDDGHMQSRFGGPRSEPLQAPRIEGTNGFEHATASGAAPIGVKEQWLAGSQHPWTGRATGLSNATASRSSLRPESRSQTRHTRNPGSWSRTGQTSGLRGSSVRRSSGGR